MHRAFRTTLSNSLAACAALAASATLASNEGVVNVMPNIIKENEDNKKKWDYNWDRMDSNVQTSTTSTRVIHLVRHGQFNQKGKDDSKHSLTALGKKQASLAGKRLRDIIPQGTIPKRTLFIISDANKVVVVFTCKHSPSFCFSSRRASFEMRDDIEGFTVRSLFHHLSFYSHPLFFF